MNNEKVGDFTDFTDTLALSGLSVMSGMAVTITVTIMSPVPRVMSGKLGQCFKHNNISQSVTNAANQCQSVSQLTATGIQTVQPCVRHNMCNHTIHKYDNEPINPDTT